MASIELRASYTGLAVLVAIVAVSFGVRIGSSLVPVLAVVSVDGAYVSHWQIGSMRAAVASQIVAHSQARFRFLSHSAQDFVESLLGSESVDDGAGVLC